MTNVTTGIAVGGWLVGSVNNPPTWWKDREKIAEGTFSRMGLFDLLRGKERRPSRAEAPKRRRGERGKARTPSERMALEEARFLNNLRRNNPTEYRKLMQRHIGRKFGIEDDDSSELAQLARTVGQLKELGLISGGFGGGGKDSWIRDAVDGLKLLMQAAPVAVAPSAAATNGSSGNGVVQVTEIPPTPTLAAALASHSTSVATAPPSAPSAEVKMTPMSQYLIAQLEHKTPAEAAEWLVSQRRTEAQQFVAGLCTTPDAEHTAMLDRLAAEVPDLAAFVAWVRAHPEQLTATVQELRIRTNQFPPLHPSQNVGM